MSGKAKLTETRLTGATVVNSLLINSDVIVSVTDDAFIATNLHQPDLSVTSPHSIPLLPDKLQSDGITPTSFLFPSSNNILSISLTHRFNNTAFETPQVVIAVDLYELNPDSTIARLPNQSTSFVSSSTVLHKFKSTPDQKLVYSLAKNEQNVACLFVLSLSNNSINQECKNIGYPTVDDILTFDKNDNRFEITGNSLGFSVYRDSLPIAAGFSPKTVPTDATLNPVGDQLLLSSSTSLNLYNVPAWDQVWSVSVTDPVHFMGFDDGIYCCLANNTTRVYSQHGDIMSDSPFNEKPCHNNSFASYQDYIVFSSNDQVSLYNKTSMQLLSSLHNISTDSKNAPLITSLSEKLSIVIGSSLLTYGTSQGPHNPINPDELSIIPIILIGVGCSLIVLTLVLAFFYFRLRKNKDQKDPIPPASSTFPPSPNPSSGHSTPIVPFLPFSTVITMPQPETQKHQSLVVEDMDSGESRGTTPTNFSYIDSDLTVKEKRDSNLTVKRFSGDIVESDDDGGYEEEGENDDPFIDPINPASIESESFKTARTGSLSTFRSVSFYSAEEEKRSASFYSAEDDEERTFDDDDELDLPAVYFDIPSSGYGNDGKY